MTTNASQATLEDAGVSGSERRSYGERYRLLRSKWNEEWWSIAFGGPIGNVLNAFIADVPWITPNTITLVGFLCKLAIVPLVITGGFECDVAAVILLQFAVVCDCMDGSLARYRKKPSVLGAFLDKVTDAIGIVAIFGAFGWRVYTETDDALALLISVGIATSLVIRGYVYWVVAALEKDAARATTGVDTRLDYSRMSAGDRLRLYIKSMPRIIAFNESDLYFWLGLGLVLSESHTMIYVLGVALACWFVGIMTMRISTVIRLERSRQQVR